MGSTDHPRPPLRTHRRAHLRCADGCGRTFVVSQAELQVGDGVRCPWCRRVTPADRVEHLERQVARGPSVRYGAEMLALARASAGLQLVGTTEQDVEAIEDGDNGPIEPGPD